MEPSGWYYAQSHDAVFTIRDGAIQTANPGAAAMLGVPAEELLGKSLLDFSPKLQSDGVESATALGRILSNSTTNRTSHPWELAGASGTIHCELDSWEAPTAGRDELLVCLHDVTRWKDLEGKLSTRTAQLQATLESLPFDFWINDSQNRTIMQNSFSKSLWGDTYGLHMEEVTPDEQILQIWRETNRRALAGEIVTGEIAYDMHDGKRVFRNIVAPVRDRDQVIGILGLNIDITDYKEAVREREVLLQELHHRVKNSLQLLISMLNLRIDHAELVQAEILREVEQQIYTVYLVHEHLFTHRQFDRVSLDEYLSGLVSALQQAVAAQKRNVRLTCDCAALAAPIDRAISLGVIVNELVTNSLKHAFGPGDTGEVSVSLKAEPGGNLVLLTVSDTGTGSSAEIAGTGRGIGLVRVLSRHLGGTVNIDQTGGYTVTVTLSAETVLNVRDA